MESPRNFELSLITLSLRSLLSVIEAMPKTPNRRLTYKERTQIHTLYFDCGWTQQAIAKKLGCSQQTVSHCIRSPQTPTKPRGRPCKLTTPIRKLLVAHATQNAQQRRKPREQIASELGINACSRTLAKAFEKEMYHRRVATEKPLLTAAHRRARLVWAWSHLNWELDDWDRVLWSDEFLIRTGGGQVFVTRRAEEKYLPECCVAKFRGYSSWIAWGMISSKIKGPLVFFEKEWNDGKVNSEVYIQHILPWIRSVRYVYEQFIRKSTILMEDGSSVHTSKATKAAHQRDGNTLMIWPANSPDLNPIENVWRLLKYRVAKRFPTTDNEVRRYTEEEWAALKLEDFQKYCLNMKERCWAVIQADGGHTKW